MHVEEAALAGAEVGWKLNELAGDERPGAAVDEKDRAQLGQRVDDALQALVQARLVLADSLVRHAAQNFVHLGDGALYDLKDLEGMLVKDIEGTLDAVGGDGLLVTIVQPARETEKDERQYDRGNHHQLQQPNCRLASGTHFQMMSRTYFHIMSRFKEGDQILPFCRRPRRKADISDFGWTELARNFVG